MSNARSLLAVSLLAAGMVAWAALPMAGARAGAKPVLIVAICCAVLGLARLPARGPRVRAASETGGIPGGDLFLPAPQRFWQQSVSGLLALPWPQLLVVAVIGLEALHP